MCKVLFTPLRMYILYYDVTLQQDRSEVSMVSLPLSTFENTFVLTVLFFLSPSHLCKMNHSWIQTDSEKEPGPDEQPASYGLNILINFNTKAQMRVNHPDAVLSNLLSLFIKTFLTEL